MCCIVQFPHPGAEHAPDQRGGSHKQWNAGNHKRKFLLSQGDYVDGKGRLHHSADMTFWGEWEPPSDVWEFPLCKNELGTPRWLHRPYLPRLIPSNKKDSSCATHKTAGCASHSNFQNTDPFVFDHDFKYFVCKQFKTYSKHSPPGKVRSTRMANLEPGSLILFGSTLMKPKPSFHLDTVFVVGAIRDYDPSKTQTAKFLGVSETYFQSVYRMAFPEPAKYYPILRIYSGATFENSFNGMYSFSPARPYAGQLGGFPRVQLAAKDFETVTKRGLDFLSDNLNSAPRITTCKKNDVKEVWSRVRDLCRKHQCLEGVRFSYLKEDQRSTRNSPAAKWGSP